MQLKVVPAVSLTSAEITKLRDRDKCTLGHFSGFRVGFSS
jgi:hypothetical protein